MNRSIEDRVTAALDARADLVRPEDLAPIQIPAPRRGPWRGVVPLLVAAAAAAVIAIPFVLGGGDDGSPDPAPSPTPSVTESLPTASAEPTEPTEPTAPNEVVIDRQKADVDGDGRPDDVQVLLHGTDAEEPGDGSVEVTLAMGNAGGAVSVPFGYPERLLPALDLNGDGREQVLLSFTAGGDSAPLLVYTWNGDGLVEAQVQGKAPLVLELDREGTVAYYYVDQGVLMSWLRREPLEPGSTIYTVEQWSWAVDGARLVSTKAADACVDITSQDTPQEC